MIIKIEISIKDCCIYIIVNLWSISLINTLQRSMFSVIKRRSTCFNHKSRFLIQELIYQGPFWAIQGLKV